jgi:predicted nucleotidyltransferase
MTMNAARPSLDEIARRVSEAHHAAGVLLHGSYADDESNAGSDIDLICVTGDGRSRHSMMEVGGVVADVYTSPAPLLEQAMRADRTSNNNFVLEAFACGRALLDGDGRTAALIRLAKEVWEAGPLKPGLEEQRTIAAALQKSVSAARRFPVKSLRSPEAGDIAQIDLSNIFLQAMFAYCRVHQLWSSTIWHVFKWRDPRYGELVAMGRRYMRAPSLEERVAALGDMVEVILSRMDVAPRP